MLRVIAPPGRELRRQARAVPEVFQQAMQLMRRRDPQDRENGFAPARDHAAELVDELLAEFARESGSWTVLLAARTDWTGQVRTCLAHLGRAASRARKALRSWARIGLESLGTAAARRELGRARANGAIS